jgi:uncharacterized membrane protein YcaP (DUF421 family)
LVAVRFLGSGSIRDFSILDLVVALMLAAFVVIAVLGWVLDH